MNHNSTFGTKEVAKIVDRTIHKTIAYVKRGLITPMKDANGHGSKRVWSYANLIRMCMIVELEGHGLSVEMLRHYSNLIPDAWLLTSDRLVAYRILDDIYIDPLDLDHARSEMVSSDINILITLKSIRRGLDQ
jgi:DNA-binding transcriptional MerR regulator